MAELFGREDGTARGRGGSMHIFDGERRFMGGYGIVGGNLPIAAGLALASDLKGTDEVTVCMFGDGASNTGNFGETMNLAALWSLPIVFLVENNLYGMGTSIERHSAVTDLSHKAEGLGVPGERVDGMDMVAMRECVTDHLKTAREDRKPTLVEAFTYRYRGHSAADPEVYREKEEVEEWQQKDPIESFARRLVEAGLIEEGYLDELREEVEEQVMERGRVRRRLAGAAARFPLRQPLRGRGARARAGTRSTSAPPTRSAASASARPPRRTGSATSTRPAPAYGGQSSQRAAAARGRAGETGEYEGRPADEAQEDEEGPDRRRGGFRGRGRRRADEGDS